MSNPEASPCEAWFLWASAPPTDLEVIVNAIPTVYRLFGVRPTRMAYTVGTKIGIVRRSVYSLDRVTRLIEDPDTTSLHVMTREGGPVAELAFHLRDIPGLEKHTTRRHAILYRGAADDVAEGASRAFLTAAIRAYPLAQGGAVRAPTRWHASSEASLVLHRELSVDAEQRLKFDSSNEREATHLARRLYPVTIISASLWAKLPPMPTGTPPPTVEEVANCRVLTCWPELTDPHDLKFLLATRELRRWLWPYTIQNPADDPDAVDSKLRWAGLLPWDST